jgi:hypothetical protein
MGRAGMSSGKSRMASACSTVTRSSSTTCPGSLLLNHLTEAVAALDLHLTGDEVRALQEPYTPHGPSWF